MALIALLEPDAAARRVTSAVLAASGHQVAWASGGGSFLDLVAKRRPLVALVELRLNNGMSGFEVVRTLRGLALERRLLIAATSHGADPKEVVRALESGADDFIAKPVDCEVLLARLGALLRRDAWRKGEAAPKPALRVGRLTVDRERHTADLAGLKLALRPMEFELLHYLCNHMDRVIPRSLLLEAVWKGDGGQATRTVDKTVETLRRKVAGVLRIESVYGVGYRMGLSSGKSARPGQRP